MVSLVCPRKVLVNLPENLLDPGLELLDVSVDTRGALVSASHPPTHDSNPEALRPRVTDQRTSAVSLYQTKNARFNEISDFDQEKLIAHMCCNCDANGARLINKTVKHMNIYLTGILVVSACADH